MARFLQQLLNAKEPLFSHGLMELEKASGQRGIDVALIGDIHARAHELLRQWGLDPADSTIAEIYAALESRANSRRLRMTKYSAVLTERGVISLNPDDVGQNRNLPFGVRTNQGMRDALAHEIVKRYIDAGVAEERVRRVLNDAGIQMAENEQKEKQ